MAEMSPLTGVIHEEEVFLEFGKYQGKSVKEVASLDPVFYDELVEAKEQGFYAMRRHSARVFYLYPNPFSLGEPDSSSASVAGRDAVGQT